MGCSRRITRPLAMFQGVYYHHFSLSSSKLKSNFILMEEGFGRSENHIVLLRFPSTSMATALACRIPDSLPDAARLCDPQTLFSHPPVKDELRTGLLQGG